MTHAKPRRGGGHEEEHENHERWAVSYADMMTVLMALFLVLFAMSSIDVKKFNELRTSLAQGFGNQALPTDSGSGVVDGSTDSPVQVGNDVNPTVMDSTDSGSSSASSNASISGLGTAASQELAARSEASTEQAEQQQVQSALDAKGLGDQVQTTITPEGVQVSLVATNTLFASASAVIQPQGLAVIDAISGVLRSSGRQISVDGHANNLAISSSFYPNNWALAAARAGAVVTRLQEADGVPGDLMRAISYGDTHPVYADSDPRAVEGNRRVDIVIESAVDPTTAAQAAAIANGSTSTSTTTTTSTSDVSTTGSQR